MRKNNNKMSGLDGLKYHNIAIQGTCRRCCYTETRSYWLSVGLFAPKTNKAVDWRPAVHQESLLTTRNTDEQWYLVMNHSMAAATQ